MNEVERIKARIKTFQEHGASLKGAKVYFREDWETLYFDLAGKMFGMMSPEPEKQTRITLKNLPEKNEELREMYHDITPGYYTNKQHWNSIDLRTQELSDEEIKGLIDISYQLVLQKLPKKQQQEILK